MKKANYHIGETNVNTQGHLMKITNYRKRIDIDVEFEDGVIRKGVRYENFKVGKILHPNDKPKSKFIGEEHINKNGDKAKLIRIVDSHTVDIQFEDGTIRKSLHYQHFKNGRFKHPNQHKFYCQNMIGKKFINKDGLSLEIISYKNKNNITVKFEDGIIKNNVRLGNLKKGIVQHPNKPASSHEMYLWFLLKDYGFKKYPISYFKKMGLGNYEIDLFNSDLNIGIEYDGLRFHSSKEKVESDSDKNSKCSNLGIDLIRIRSDLLPELNNKEFKEFKYHIYNCNNYDSYFKVLKKVFTYLNQKYNLKIPLNFQIDPEEFYQWRSNNFCLNCFKHFGETRKNSQGETMKLVDYINYNNITVEFNNGIRKFGRRYSEFDKGYILNSKVAKV